MKNTTIQKIRFFFAFLISTMYIAGFLGFFYPIKIFDINIAPLIERIINDFTLSAGILFSLILLLTFLFGRIYCSTLCPLGLFQEFSLFLFRQKRLPQQKNRCEKYFITAIIFGSLLGGTVYILRFIDPYTISGSALSKTTIGIALATLIALLAILKGRYFCTNICPVGTLLGLISRYSVYKIKINSDSCVACGLCSQNCPSGCIDFKNKTVDNETCIKCFKCLTLCHNHGIIYSKKQTPLRLRTPEFSASRRRFLINAATVATFCVAYKAGIKLSTKIAHKIKNVLLPAGADSPERFANKCLNCNLCVENCPMKIIKKADSTFPAIHLEYGKNYCSYNCNKCSKVCPSGAIRRLTLKEKRKTQIGLAKTNPDICIQCGLCVRECPKQAIIKPHGDFPQINSDICIGCGACQAVCPVSAIKITPLKSQQTTSK